MDYDYRIKMSVREVAEVFDKVVTPRLKKVRHLSEKEIEDEKYPECKDEVIVQIKTFTLSPITFTIEFRFEFKDFETSKWYDNLPVFEIGKTFSNSMKDWIVLPDNESLN